MTIVVWLVLALVTFGLAPAVAAHPLERPPAVETEVGAPSDPAADGATRPDPPAAALADVPAPAPAPGSSAWAVAGAILALLLASARAGARRIVAAALVLLVVGAAFEAGLHSVHHLADPHTGSDCAWSATTSHLGATAVEPVCLAPPSAAGVPFDLPDASGRPQTGYRPDRGRAPPA